MAFILFTPIFPNFSTGKIDVFRLFILYMTNEKNLSKRTKCNQKFSKSVLENLEKLKKKSFKNAFFQCVYICTCILVESSPADLILWAHLPQHPVWDNQSDAFMEFTDGARMLKLSPLSTLKPLVELWLSDRASSLNTEGSTFSLQHL